MLLVQSWVRFAPASMPQFLAIGAKMIAATNAEDGCLHYTFAEDIADPGLVLISERWRDQAAIDAHAKSAHMGEFIAAMGQLEQLGIDIRLYAGEEIHRIA